MSTPPPPIAASSEPNPQPAPGLSPMQRVVNTFVAPRKTFEDIRINASWWLPFVLSAMFSLAFGIVAVQKLDMVRFAREQNERSKMAQRRMEQMSPEQREQANQIGATFSKVVFFATPVLSLISALILAGILMGVFNFGFAAEISYQRALAIVFFAFLPRIIYSILLGVSLFVSPDPNSIDITRNPMPTSPAFAMSPDGNAFLYSLISNLDVFAIWPLILLGLGFAVVSSNRKLRPGTAIATVFTLYGIVTVIGAGIKAATS